MDNLLDLAKKSKEHLRSRSGTPVSQPPSDSSSSIRRSMPPPSKKEPGFTALTTSAVSNLQPRVWPLQRDDSGSSSVITAVRDNSGRSSANANGKARPALRGSRGDISNGRENSSEAITAAARAMSKQQQGLG